MPFLNFWSGGVQCGDHWQTSTKLMAAILIKPADFQGKQADQKAIMNCCTQGQTERNYHRLF